ncbi:hypothetical protein BKA70DRAFT_1035271, partial [Coprinopsis sp. MPI-PUGE-AT-0042]
MGKLNIAHHKSYHPYRRDNIERVKKDEEEALLKEEKEEGRMLLADAEARIQVLRERAEIDSSSKEKKKRDRNDTKDLDEQLRTGVSQTMSAGVGAQLPTTNGHINFFEDLESQNAMAAISQASAKHKAKPVAETEKGVALAPSEKDLRPWYSSSKPKGPEDTPMEELPEDRRKRQEARKAEYDPLTSITKQLSSKKSSQPGSSRQSYPQPSNRSKPSMPPPDAPPPVQARLTRESSERQRALALIERKKREAALAAAASTPSTSYGRTPYGANETPGYSDQFNKEEVQLAHRSKDYVERWRSGGGRERRWDEDEER